MGKRLAGESASSVPRILAPCCALPSAVPPSADSIKIFGVDVYLLEHPSCSGSSREVLANASPFEKEARLADIITELARRTREAGANTLHSIRICPQRPITAPKQSGLQ